MSDRGRGGFRGGPRGRGGGDRGGGPSHGGHRGTGDRGGGGGGYRGSGDRGGGGGYRGSGDRGGGGGYRGSGDRGGSGGGYHGSGDRGGGGGYRGSGDRGGGGGGYRGAGDRGGGGGGYRGGQGSDYSRGGHGGGGYAQRPAQLPIVPPRVQTVPENKPVVNHLAPLGYNDNEEFDPANMVPPKSLPAIKQIPGSYHIDVTANCLEVGIQKPKWPGMKDIFIHKYDLKFTKIGGGKSPSKAGRGGKAGGRGRGGRSGGGGAGAGDAPVPDRIRGKLIKYLLSIWTRSFTQPVFTDFKKFLITYIPFRPKEPSNPVNVSMNEIGDEDEASNSAQYTVEVSLGDRIEFTPALEQFFADPQQFIEQRNLNELPTTVDDLTQIFNIIVRTNAVKNSDGNPAQNMIIIPNAPSDESSVVQWSGTSLRFTFGWRPFNTVNVSAVVIGQPVFDALTKLWAKNQRSVANPTDASTVSRFDLESANAFLTDCKVEYGRIGSKRKKLVKEVKGVGASQHTFNLADGSMSNVYDYFTGTLRQNLTYRNGICLDLGNNCVVPAEACTIVRGQVLSKKVSDAQEKLPTAAERLGKIEANNNSLALSGDGALIHCGVNIAGKLLQLDKVRILPTPTLVYGSSNDRQQIEITPPKDGKNAGLWDMWRQGSAEFHEPAGQDKGKTLVWSIINIKSRNRGETAEDGDARSFGTSLKGNLVRGGLNIGDYSGYEEIDASRPTYTATLLSKLQELKNKNHDFVLVIMSGKEQYPAIKTIAETSYRKIGILTQCVFGKNVKKTDDKRLGIVQNICLKLNQKLGGTNYWVKLEKTWEMVDVLKEPVLIIGADVTHPEKLSNLPSFAAVTASTDRTGMPYQVEIIVQENQEKGSAAEVIYGLAQIVKRFIKTFAKNTGHKPRKIFYYRDGVGDSQFGEVLQAEMLQIREGCRLALQEGILTDALCYEDVKLGEKIGNMGAYEPKITFVTVQKRHKVRFFWKNPDPKIGIINIPPGTLVDTIVVNPKMTNFYLASHIGIQGTTIPTHYQVLWDDSEFEREELVILTYYLCFMFCRCTRSVSYPAPTYYSHLAAARAKVFATSLGRDYDYANLPALRNLIDRHDGFLESFPMHFT